MPTEREIYTGHIAALEARDDEIARLRKELSRLYDILPDEHKRQVLEVLHPRGLIIGGNDLRR